jgi:hypothetical protein
MTRCFTARPRRSLPEYAWRGRKCDPSRAPASLPASCGQDGLSRSFALPKRITRDRSKSKAEPESRRISRNLSPSRRDAQARTEDSSRVTFKRFHGFHLPIRGTEPRPGRQGPQPHRWRRPRELQEPASIRTPQPGSASSVCFCRSPRSLCSRHGCRTGTSWPTRRTCWPASCGVPAHWKERQCVEQSKCLMSSRVKLST